MTQIDPGEWGKQEPGIMAILNGWIADDREHPFRDMVEALSAAEILTTVHETADFVHGSSRGPGIEWQGRELGWNRDNADLAACPFLGWAKRDGAGAAPAKMNCWEYLLYVAQRSGCIGTATLRHAYLAKEGHVDQAVVERIFQGGAPLDTTRPSVGDAIVLTMPTRHVFLSLGGDDVADLGTWGTVSVTKLSYIVEEWRERALEQLGERSQTVLVVKKNDWIWRLVEAEQRASGAASDTARGARDATVDVARALRAPPDRSPRRVHPGAAPGVQDQTALLLAQQRVEEQRLAEASAREQEKQQDAVRRALEQKKLARAARKAPPTDGAPESRQ